MCITSGPRTSHWSKRLGCPGGPLVPLSSTHSHCSAKVGSPWPPSSGATLPSFLVHNKPIARSCEHPRSGLERQKRRFSIQCVLRAACKRVVQADAEGAEPISSRSCWQCTWRARMYLSWCCMLTTLKCELTRKGNWGKHRYWTNGL